jgi:ABC transporter substrate binding protein
MYGSVRGTRGNSRPYRDELKVFVGCRIKKYGCTVDWGECGREQVSGSRYLPYREAERLSARRNAMGDYAGARPPINRTTVLLGLARRFGLARFGLKVANLAMQVMPQCRLKPFDLPSIYSYHEHVRAGGLMTYTTNYYDVFRRQGLFIDKIFKGAKAGDLPVQQPTKFELMLNLKTAKALDLAFPPSLLALADEVIE